MKITNTLTTIDTHTAGAPTRIITGGIPYLNGKTIKDRMHCFQENHDSFRKLLLHEPRGHKDMYGAIVFEPIEPLAELGAFFMTNSGYLPICIHSIIGIASAFLETGRITVPSDEAAIVFETAGGLITATPNYNKNNLINIHVKTQPTFILHHNKNLNIGGTTLKVDIVFSGVVFLLVRNKQIEDIINTENFHEYSALGRLILDKANNAFEIFHSENTSDRQIKLALFYDQKNENVFNDIVISSAGTIDRSPCGAGVAALATKLVFEKQLDFNTLIKVIGPSKGIFQVQALAEANVGQSFGILPSVIGSAYITGMHNFILCEGDKLNEGFLV